MYNRGLAAEGIPNQYKVAIKARLDAIRLADTERQRSESRANVQRDLNHAAT